MISEQINTLILSELGSELDQIPSTHTCSAAQAYVSIAGDVVAHDHWGMSRLAPDVMIGPKTRMDIASVSKLFTASAAMIAVDEGLLSFDTEIEHFFPKLAKSKISLLQLLNHSSGLPAWDKFYERFPMLPTPEVAAQTRDSIESEILVKPRKEAGSTYAYSDLGYMLLGYLLELVFEDSLNHIVQARILNPLGMSLTDYRSMADGQQPFEDAVATEFCETRGKPVIGFVHDENTWIQGGVAGHAGLFSVAEDLGMFGEHMLAIDRGLNGIISREVLQFAWSEASRGADGHHLAGWDTPSGERTSVGRGFSRSESFGHLGFTGTSLWIDRSQEIVAVLLTNRVYPTRENARIQDLRIRFHESVASPS